jgi:hypothetical protein
VAPVLWLTPLDAAVPQNDHGGAIDYDALFQPGAPWSAVAKRTQFFKIYPEFVREAPEEVLRRVTEGLANRHIALALEAPVLTRTANCKRGIEPFDPVLPQVHRLAGIGANLQAVAMNGPLVSGHTADTPDSCHAPIEAVAADAANSVRAMRAVFPRLEVGDVEPIGHGEEPGHWAETIAQWLAAFEAASGHKLAFLHLDVGWNGDWENELRAVAKVARRSGVPIGVIYDGDQFELSDQAWAEDAREHYEAVESVLDGSPDHVVFQSWNRNPTRALPESDSNSLTGIARDWLRPRTRIQRLPGGSGLIAAQSGTPLEGAKLAVEFNAQDPSGGLIHQKVTGVVPQDTASALFGLRLHIECRCNPALASIALGDFRFAQPGHPPYDLDLRSWAEQEPTRVVPIDPRRPDVLRVNAEVAQRLMLNGPRFAVTPGAEFLFTFSWQIPIESDGTGFVALIFFGADGIERTRTIHAVRATWRELYSLKSDSRGRFPWPASNRRVTRLVFTGDPAHRPASQLLSPH